MNPDESKKEERIRGGGGGARGDEYGSGRVSNYGGHNARLLFPVIAAAAVEAMPM